MRAAIILIGLGLIGLMVFLWLNKDDVTKLAREALPGLSEPATDNASGSQEAPTAHLTIEATMIAGKRIEINASLGQKGTTVFVDRVRVVFLKDTGEIWREIPFEIGQSIDLLDFKRRLPLEPDAQLVGICAVYGASKSGPMRYSGALFLNKGEAPQSTMHAASLPDGANADPELAACFTGSAG